MTAWEESFERWRAQNRFYAAIDRIAQRPEPMREFLPDFIRELAEEAYERGWANGQSTLQAERDQAAQPAPPPRRRRSQP